MRSKMAGQRGGGVSLCAALVVDLHPCVVGCWGMWSGMVMRKMLLWRVADFCGVELLTYCLNGQSLLMCDGAGGKAQGEVEDAEVFGAGRGLLCGGAELWRRRNIGADIQRPYRKGGEEWSGWAEAGPAGADGGCVVVLCGCLNRGFSGVVLNRRGDRTGTTLGAALHERIGWRMRPLAVADGGCVY